MAKIPFNVSARTARLIGRENVTNASGAVIELVKNAHDADAKKALIIFDESGDLYVVDNGHGMTERVIRDAWMTIGTDYKEVAPYSPKRRIKAGAKGIGRFALDRLGEKAEMFTLPAGETLGYCWSIDWAAFEKKGATVDDVKATLEKESDLNLLKKLPASYQDFSKSKRINFPKGGTIIRISSLRDSWVEKNIEELYQNLESLVPPMEKDSFTVELISLTHPSKFGQVKPLINEDFDYRISARYDNSLKLITAKVERKEFDFVMLKKKFGDVFLHPLMSEPPFTIDTFKRGSYEKTYKVNEIMRGFNDSDNLLEKIGDFSFTLTFAKNQAPNREDLKKYPYRNAEYTSREKWLGKFSGIKVFRDNFRVRPYGENGEDWLLLGERQAQSPAGPGQRLGGYRIRPNQVAGVVAISRIYNTAFQDKSSREGIQENEAFRLFKNLLIGIISILEKDRNTVFYCLSELYKKTDEKERIKVDAREAAARIKKDSEGGSRKKWDDDAEKVVQAIDVLETEVEEQKEEIKILRSLASAGLITAAVAHELRGLENILVVRNKDLRILLKPYLKEEIFKGVKDAFNPFILLKEMEHTDKSLQEWLNYALMPLKRDKRTRKKIFLLEYFSKLREMWENLLAERQINFFVENIKDSYAVNLFPIDLDTIFNNLIINSIESFSRKKEVEKRIIKLSCKFNENNIQIIYQDNGAGLDPIYKNEPSLMFLPQETTKRDSSGKLIGTGMGMYLIKSVIDENNGSVEVDKSHSGFLINVILPAAK